MQYVLPLMLTVMSARLIGNIFIDGLYDIHIHTRQLNFLDEDEGTIFRSCWDIYILLYWLYMMWYVPRCQQAGGAT